MPVVRLAAARCPVPGAEEAVLVVEVGRIDSGDRGPRCLELHALDDPAVIGIARRAECNQGLVRVGRNSGVDVERRTMALAEMTPDSETITDQVPTVPATCWSASTNGRFTGGRTSEVIATPPRRQPLPSR